MRFSFDGNIFYLESVLRVCIVWRIQKLLEEIRVQQPGYNRVGLNSRQNLPLGPNVVVSYSYSNNIEKSYFAYWINLGN